MSLRTIRGDVIRFHMDERGEMVVDSVFVQGEPCH